MATTTMRTTVSATSGTTRTETGFPKKRRLGLGLTTRSPLPPPCTYDKLYSSYGFEWEQRKTFIPPHVEILDVAWIDEGHVACATSLGHVWVYSSSSGPNSDNNNDIHSTPVAHWKVSSKPLRSLQVARTTTTAAGKRTTKKSKTTTTTLLMGGDDGLWSIPTKELLSSSGTSNQKAVQSWDDAVQGAIRQVLVLENTDGTSTGVLILTDHTVTKYDMESKQKIACYHVLGPNTTATTMAMTTTTATGLITSDGGTPSSSPMLLIGTSSSQVLIWDMASNTNDNAKINNNNKALEPLVLHKANGSKKTMGLALDSSVTCICITQDQWWTIATSSRTGGGGGGGSLSTWHGPTRSLVACVETRETIQRIVSVGPTLYSVANEGVVSVWQSPYQLERTHRISTGPPSGKALAACSPNNNNNNVVVVVLAGIGPKLDVLQDHCRVQTLELAEPAKTTESNKEMMLS
jgi:hypothetical protein